jgi:ERCC4-type nuclease
MVIKDGGMKRRTPTLIKSPLEWNMASAPVPHPTMPVLAERGGTQLRTPKATLLIDTREQNPVDLSRFEGWFAGVEKRALVIGDYSIAGLEEICVVERKDLPDLVHSFTADRAVFVERIKKMSAYPHKLLVITAAMSEVKSRYPFSTFNPNRVMQALIATLAGWGVPFLCTETHELGEEIVASYLYQVHLYKWLEANSHGKYLADGDL